VPAGITYLNGFPSSLCRSCYSPNSTYVVTSGYDLTCVTCRARRDERVKPCCSKLADDEQAIVLVCTSLVVLMLLHTQILFVPSNEINQINVYSNKVNNLHIITL